MTVMLGMTMIFGVFVGVVFVAVVVLSSPAPVGSSDRTRDDLVAVVPHGSSHGTPYSSRRWRWQLCRRDR